MIIVVTGSTGLVGSELIESLERNGHLVRRMVPTTPNEIRL